MQDEPEKPDEEQSFSISDNELKKKSEQLTERTEDVLKEFPAPRLPENPIPSAKQEIRLPGENLKAGQRNIALGLAIAYALLGPALIGWGIGALVDLKTGSHLGQMTGLIFGVLLGVICVIIVQAKNNKNMKK